MHEKICKRTFYHLVYQSEVLFLYLFVSIWLLDYFWIISVGRGVVVLCKLYTPDMAIDKKPYKAPYIICILKNKKNENLTHCYILEEISGTRQKLYLHWKRLWPIPVPSANTAGMAIFNWSHVDFLLSLCRSMLCLYKQTS